jgi:exosortase family protein XrtF
LIVVFYNVYLSQYTGQTDVLTIWVGKMVTKIYHWLGLNVQTLPLTEESGLKLIINGNYVARIVEGCTAISVIILFVAFVISFGQNFKKSLLFAAIGSLLIFVFNLLRIVFLGYLLYAYPQYQDMAHRIVFPAMIYGFVVILWLVFIKKMQ